MKTDQFGIHGKIAIGKCFQLVLFPIFECKNYLTLSATATAYVTGHDWSLTSKMTGWGAVMTGLDWSHTSKMTSWDRFVTGWGAVCNQSHTSKMTGQRAVCTATSTASM